MPLESSSMNPMDLSGRTVLVTGASSGIGRETAVLLSQLNARVVITARNEERLHATLAALHGDAETQGHRAEPFDLSRTDEIPKWLQGVAAQTGPLHAIVHAAGKQASLPIRFVSAEKVDDLVRTNLYSAILLARGFSQKNCHAPGGSLVFLSSITAFASKPAISVYAATKSALVGLTKSLALELAPQGPSRQLCRPGFRRDRDAGGTALGAHRRADGGAAKLASTRLWDTSRCRHAIAFLIAETGRWITARTWSSMGDTRPSRPTASR